MRMMLSSSRLPGPIMSNRAGPLWTSEPVHDRAVLRSVLRWMEWYRSGRRDRAVSPWVKFGGSGSVGASDGAPALLWRRRCVVRRPPMASRSLPRPVRHSATGGYAPRPRIPLSMLYVQSERPRSAETPATMTPPGDPSSSVHKAALGSSEQRAVGPHPVVGQRYRMGTDLEKGRDSGNVELALGNVDHQANDGAVV